MSKIYNINNLIYDFPNGTKFLSSDDLFRINLGELQVYDASVHEWRKTVNSIKQILEMKFIKVEF